MFITLFTAGAGAIGQGVITDALYQNPRIAGWPVPSPSRAAKVLSFRLKKK